MNIRKLIILIFSSLISLPSYASERLALKKHKTHLTRAMLAALDETIWQCDLGNCDNHDQQFRQNRMAHAQKVWEQLSIHIPTNYREKISSILNEYSFSLRQVKTFEDLGKWHNQLRSLLIQTLDLDLVPAVPPKIAIAKHLYKEHCASCHGNEGKGNGLLAKRLNQPIVDATRSLNQKYTSPAMIFNFLLSEQASGVMPDYSNLLSIDELWAISFYWKQLKEDSSWQVNSIQQSQLFQAGVSLHLLATSTDNQLVDWLIRNKKEILNGDEISAQKVVWWLRNEAPYQAKIPRNF